MSAATEPATTVGSVPPDLSAEARLVAVADAYHTMTEPRPHPAPTVTCRRGGGARRAEQSWAVGRRGGQGGARCRRAGRPPSRVPRGAHGPRGGGTRSARTRDSRSSRSAEGSESITKTASRHVQNIYPKIGVSTRAAAAVFAMQHRPGKMGERPEMAGEQAGLLASITQPHSGPQEAVMNTVKDDSRKLTSTRSDLMRWSALAGIAGPVLFALGFLVQEQLSGASTTRSARLSAPSRRLITAGCSKPISSPSAC